MQKDKYSATGNHLHLRPALWLAIGLGAAALGWRLQQSRRDKLAWREDSAPQYAEKKRRFGGYAVTGNTVTINRPRQEVYSFWRNFTNLPNFMENVREVVPLDNNRWRWSIAGPAGTTIDLETAIVEDRKNEMISWRSLENSDVQSQGSVHFRDAPGGRGTQLEAVIAYKPPGGEIGRWIAKIFRREPSIQGRRELKRLKMLLETGEIANAKHHDPDQAAQQRRYLKQSESKVARGDARQ